LKANKIKPNRTLVGTILPDSTIVKYGLSQAGNNFTTKFIQAGKFSHVISYYPSIINDEKELLNNKSFNLKLSNIRGIKTTNVFSKFISYILINFKIFISAKSAKNIWYYNLYPPTLLSYILLLCYGKNIYILVADYKPSRYLFSISYLIYLLKKKAKGIISLSSRTNLKHKKFNFIPGIHAEFSHSFKQEHFLNKTLTFLMSGTLSESNGISLALKSFSKLKDFKLIISGRGCEKISMEYAAKYPNIRYLGYQSYDNYLETLKEIDVCLSLRNPNYEENKHNFPSKIFEYFASRKLIISTIDYPEINNFNYLKAHYTEKSLIGAIQNINLSEIKNITAINYKTLQNTMNLEAWNEAIKKMENEN
jgi:hypothetical protein